MTSPQQDQARAACRAAIRARLRELTDTQLDRLLAAAMMLATPETLRRWASLIEEDEQAQHILSQLDDLA